MDTKYTASPQSGPSTNPAMAKIINWQAEFYESLRSKGRSPNTLKNYKTDLDCFNQYLIEAQSSLDIENYSIPQILEYGKYLEHKYSSDNSRRRRVQALRLFFDFMVEKNIFNHNPVKKVPTSPKFLDIPRPTSLAHVKTLWMHLLEQSRPKQAKIELLKIQRNQLIFLLIYGSGLKVSDISDLRRDHFSFGKSPRVMILHPKRDPYSVALPEIFQKVYESYIELLERVKKDHKQSFSHVFFNANAHRILNGGLSARGIELIFDGWRKELMIEVTPKSLRQSAIFTWLHSGINESVIKEWLGVSPSYSLKLYRDHQQGNAFSNHFIERCYLDLMGAGLL